jgi:amino acid transporter
MVSRAQLTAALLVVLVGVINVRGIHWGAVVQNVSTALKVGALVALVGLGAALVPSLPPLPPRAPAEPALLSGFGLAMVAILWSYDGWADVGFIAGEVRDPQRALPRAFLLGTLAVVLVYLAVNIVYMQVIPVAEMSGSPLIAADVASRLVGPVGVVLVSGAVMISTFGTLNGSMMTGPRIFYAMAEDRLFFRGLARIDPRYGTPSAAILLSVVLGVVFVCIKTFAQLADQFIIGIWPFYAAGVAALFVLRRKRPEAPRPYRTWGYPFVPALFLVAATALLLNYLVTEPVVFCADFGIIALGAPVYLWWKRRRVGG